MVLGILTITAIPVTVGVAEGVHHQRKANEEVGDDASRMAKFNLEAYCDVDDGDDNTGGGGRRRRLVEQLNGKNVVLRDGKVSFSPGLGRAYAIVLFIYQWDGVMLMV